MNLYQIAHRPCPITGFRIRRAARVARHLDIAVDVCDTEIAGTSTRFTPAATGSVDNVPMRGPTSLSVGPLASHKNTTPAGQWGAR